MKVESGSSSQVKSSSQTSPVEKKSTQKDVVGSGTTQVGGDGFDTGKARQASALLGQSPAPKRLDAEQDVGTVEKGGKLIGVEAGSISNAVVDVRQDVAHNRGTVQGAVVQGDVRNSTLTIEQRIGKNEGTAEAAHIGGDVVDSVISANGKVTIDGDVSGSIIVVDKPSDLVVKGRISADTRVMTRAEYEKYQREHSLPEAGTR